MEQSGSERETVEFEPDFSGVFFDLRGEFVEAQDGGDAEHFELIEVVLVGHGANVKRIDITEVSRERLSRDGHQE